MAVLQKKYKGETKTFTVIHMTNLGKWRESQFEADGFEEFVDGGTTTLYIEEDAAKGKERRYIASFPRGFFAGLWENECLIP